MNQILEVRAFLVDLYRCVGQHLIEVTDYASGFRAINNKIAVCKKIFDSEDIRFSSNEEGIEAMKLILRDFLFIAVMSVFEYNLLTIFPHEKAPKTSAEMRKKHIRDIKFSKLVSWLEEDCLLKNIALWRFAINIRNDIVHFDSHARNTLVSPDLEIKVCVSKGEVISGELISFVKIIQKLEAGYYDLVCQLKVE